MKSDVHTMNSIWLLHYIESIITTCIAYLWFFFSDERTLLLPGHFSSVIIHENQLYVAEKNENEVHVFDYKRRALIQTRAIKLRFNYTVGKIKLCARSNRLMCSSTKHDEIHVYSLSGEFLQAYGRPGSGEAGRLDCPLISDVEADCSVLIVDRGNNRIQMMNEQGEFSVLALQPEVVQPTSPVIYNDHLYVTSIHKMTIYKYSCWLAWHCTAAPDKFWVCQWHYFWWWSGVNFYRIGWLVPRLIVPVFVWLTLDLINVLHRLLSFSSLTNHGHETPTI